MSDYRDCGIDGLTFMRPSLVKPQFAADCDLSNIVRKFIRTGELPQFRQRPNIGNADILPQSFQELQDSIADVKSQFESLPSEEREKYQNSVELWLEAKAKEEQNDEQKIEEPQEKRIEGRAQESAQPGSGDVDPSPSSQA